MNGENKTIQEQLIIFENILRKNNKLIKVLEILEKYAKKNPTFRNYYLGAGAVNQTVFNYLSNYDINYGIKDFDIVYYDSDLSYEAEDKIIKDLEKMLKIDDIMFDIKNEARVHLWYNEKYKTKREPYLSCEDAINSWGATVTCVGVRIENDKLITYCPYGLNDLFTMTIRPVKKNFNEEEYLKRANKWKKKWPLLKIINWN